MLVSVSHDAVRDLVLDELAYVRGCTRAEVDAELNGHGDLEIDSKQGQTVAIRVELRLGMDGLIRPEDQRRENLTGVASPTELVVRRVAALTPGEGC
jgi:hypothetical protein